MDESGADIECERAFLLFRFVKFDVVGILHNPFHAELILAGCRTA